MRHSVGTQVPQHEYLVRTMFAGPTQLAGPPASKSPLPPAPILLRNPRITEVLHHVSSVGEGGEDPHTCEASHLAHWVTPPPHQDLNLELYFLTLPALFLHDSRTFLFSPCVFVHVFTGCAPVFASVCIWTPKAHIENLHSPTLFAKAESLNQTQRSLT